MFAQRPTTRKFNRMRRNPPPGMNSQPALLALGAILGLALSPIAGATAAQMQDGQDYPAATSTPTTGRSPWLIASSGAPAAGATSFIGIYPTNLSGTTTPPLRGLTNTINPEARLQIAKAANSSRTYYRNIGTPLTNGSVYCSFLVNVSANPTTSDEIMCELIPAVAGGAYPANPTASDPLTLHARQGADTNHFQLGLQCLGGAVSWAPTNLAINTDYLLVLQYSFGAGQPCQLFINPFPGSAPPVGSATAIKGASSEPANIGTLLFWESASSTSGTFNYDVMRVDASWTSVTPAGGETGTTNTPPLRVLFLGNSLLGISASYSNNIPAILSNLTANLGDAFSYASIAQGGWLLADHATNATSTNQINSGNYDLVVLQEKSETPSLPPDRDTLMFPAARTLDALITNHTGRTMFYQTWGQINGDPNSNCNSYDIPAQYKTCNYPSFASFTSMNIAVRKAYAMIGIELGAAISPVGQAWARVRTEQPGLNLYILDDALGDRHPNSYGAYLAACVFYSAIFGRSPEGSTYYSTNNVSDAQYLQRVAAETVLTDPFASDAYGFGGNNYYWAYRWQIFTNSPGSPANTLVISGAGRSPSPSVKVDTNVGSIGNLTLGTRNTATNQPGQGRLYFSAGGSLVVTGAMVVGQEGKGFVRHRGGNLVVSGAMTLAESANSVGDYLLTNGSLLATRILRGDGTARFSFDGGQLSFSQFGTPLRLLDLTATGTLSLTNTDGSANLHGNYSNTSGGTLAIQLGSTTNALVVGGAAKLAGSLQISFAPGFQPLAGQQITLLAADSVMGTFSQVTLPAISASGLGLSTSLTTTSIVATVVSHAAVLTSPGVSTNGQFQFTVNEVPGQAYTVQTSTNLSAGSWIPVQTNTAPFIFQEVITSLPQRFYRVIYAP
jgi:hypothetical protein